MTTRNMHKSVGCPLSLMVALLGACSTGRVNNSSHDLSVQDGPVALEDFAGADFVSGSGDMICAGGCYTMYAHSDHTLYSVDLSTKSLKLVGAFNAPLVSGGEDVITDLAVAPDNTIYVVSQTTLYTASATDGHVTKIGSVGACGTYNVALSFTPDNKLYVADYNGEFCRIDYTVTPPTVTPIAKLSGNLAVTGDLVAVDDGTMYASAYDLSDTSTQSNNLLIKVDPATATTTTVGSTGFERLFGVAFQQGQVFGFTHDGTGRVITIDVQTGVGTLFNTFNDPMTGSPISFAGAGVNALVSPTIM